jgi:ADP-ribose pyrophosphatase YjhB (NUDIX family)
MTIEERTREEVKRRLDSLEAEFGGFPVVDETVTNDPDYFALGVERAANGWIGDAGAWVTDADGRALLIRHEGEPGRWGTPGGGHEPGETLAETARREVREETGIDVVLTGVYRARRKTVVHESNPERRFHMLTVWFEGEPANSDTTVETGDDEIVEARWFAGPPESVHDFLTEKIDGWDGAATD